jgi:hypothetical protein
MEKYSKATKLIDTIDGQRWVRLNIYLRNDRIKTYKAQYETLRIMSLKDLRGKLSIPAQINNYFFFTDRSNEEIQDEINTPIIESVINLENYLNTYSGM